MGNTDIDFAPLREQLTQGQVLVPGSPGYEESLVRWSQTCIKPAAVVVKPTSSQEVAAAVKFATATKIPLVVKCGGHSTSGASASDRGMIIDLGLMRKVTVNPEDRTVTFDGGCIWADVDNALWEHGLATVGGTVNDTGVGGLILGGGYGFLTPKYGLSIDNLLEAEIVTADGQILTVSDKENADLFWAIRGAGHSFGVATRFTMKAFEQGNAYGGFVILPLTALPTVVDFCNAAIEKQDTNSVFLWGPSFLPPTMEPGIMAAIAYNGTEAEAKEFYKPLLDVALANLATEKTFPELNAQLQSGDWGKNPRKLHGGATFVPPLKLEDAQGALDEFFPFVKEHGMEDSTVIAWEIIPNAAIRKVPHDATAFGARDNAYQICPLWQWHDPAKDDIVRQFNRKIVTQLKQSGVQDGVSQYSNYSGADDKLEPHKVYGSNVERLQQLKKKYDPENVFWKWHALF